MSTNTETRGFETEVNQLLKLMIHSLYSNSEIFLRELISNASDACDKLRFEAGKNDALLQSDPDLKIQIDLDEDAKTLTIRDNGIGMSRDEVIENIGTIARSGTKAFMEAMQSQDKDDASLIGQFGVGFYSAFIVADEVKLVTRKAGLDASAGVVWTSSGDGQYTIADEAVERRGTEIVLTLREEHAEFLQAYRVKSVVTKYSDHIMFPIEMAKEGDEEGYEAVNSATALWQRSAKDIGDDEYKSFYKTITHDYSDPMLWVHNKVEGTLEYTGLFFIPERAPFDLYERETTDGIRLYVQRVFIMEDTKKLMPRYLRFVRGLVDTNDLPLNVSREILQDSRTLDKIRAGSVKKVLSALADLAKNDADKYLEFWKTFGAVLKEGVGEEYSQRDALLKLFRMRTSHDDDGWHSFADVVSRMSEGQDKIYYLSADNLSAAKQSPHLEWFKKKGIEVVLFTDRVDEWMMSYLHEFEGKSFVNIAKSGLDLDQIDEEGKQAREEKAKSAAPLLERLKTALGEKVDEVRVSSRLVDSPACIVLSEHEMAMYMQNLLRQAGHDAPESKPNLEINPDHAVIQKIEHIADEDVFAQWAELLLDQSILAEGGQLQNGADFVKRMNQLMLG